MWLILWNNSPHNLLFFLSACTHTHHQEEERLRWIWLNGALSHERECISGWQRKPTNCNHLKNIIDSKPKSKRTLYHSNQEIDGHEKKDAQRKRKDTKKNRMRQATRSEWSSLGSALYSFFVSPTDFAFSSLDVSLCYRCCSSDFVLFFYLNCCYSLMCFVLCDDAADVDANADAMNCFFLYWARRSLPLQFIRRPDRQLYHPKRTSNKFLGVHTLRCDFSRYNWRFFFRFVRNRLFGFFKLFHGKPCILT